MNDRSWLLGNTSALSCAKNCIKIIKMDFGIKLSLSDGELLPKIGKICENMDSQELRDGYQRLLGFAGKTPHHSAAEILHSLGEQLHDVSHSFIEKIEHHGKEYPKFDDQGREFKGVYRGSVRYA